MIKHGNRGTMEWEAFSSSGVGQLIWCEKHIKTNEYINIAEKGQLCSLRYIEQISFLIFNPIGFGGTRGVMVIVVGNGHGDTSSNHGRG